MIHSRAWTCSLSVIYRYCFIKSDYRHYWEGYCIQDNSPSIVADKVFRGPAWRIFNFEHPSTWRILLKNQKECMKSQGPVPEHPPKQKISADFNTLILCGFKSVKEQDIRVLSMIPISNAWNSLFWSQKWRRNPCRTAITAQMAKVFHYSGIYLEGANEIYFRQIWIGLYIVCSWVLNKSESEANPSTSSYGPVQDQREIISKSTHLTHIQTYELLIMH